MKLDDAQTKQENQVEEMKQQISYICKECANNCDDCKVDFCDQCKVCICSVDQYEDKHGKFKCESFPEDNQKAASFQDKS